MKYVQMFSMLKVGYEISEGGVDFIHAKRRFNKISKLFISANAIKVA